MVIKLNHATAPTVFAGEPTSVVPGLAPPPMSPLALTPLPLPGQGQRMALQPETPHALRQAYFSDRQRGLMDSLARSPAADSMLTPQQRDACTRILDYLAARAAG